MPNIAGVYGLPRVYICCDHYPLSYDIVRGVPGPGGVRISVTDRFGHRDRLSRIKILTPATSYGFVLVISSNDAVARLTLFASGHGCPRVPVGR